MEFGGGVLIERKSTYDGCIDLGVLAPLQNPFPKWSFDEDDDVDEEEEEVSDSDGMGTDNARKKKKKKNKNKMMMMWPLTRADSVDSEGRVLENVLLDTIDEDDDDDDDDCVNGGVRRNNTITNTDDGDDVMMMLIPELAQQEQQQQEEEEEEEDDNTKLHFGHESKTVEGNRKQQETVSQQNADGNGDNEVHVRTDVTVDHSGDTTSPFRLYRGGMTIAGERNGMGTMIYKAGHCYVGNWMNGKFDGYGTFSFSDGRRIRGIWLAGKPGSAMKVELTSGASFHGGYDFARGKLTGRDAPSTQQQRR